MVIDDFDVVGVSISPLEADAPLVVDAYAELPDTVTGQCLEAVARQGHQIVDRFGVVQNFESSFRLGNAGLELPDSFSFIEGLCIPAAESFYHGPLYRALCCTSSVYTYEYIGL